MIDLEACRSMRGKWVFHKQIAPWWRAWVLLLLVIVCSWITFSGAAHAQDSESPFVDTTSLPDIDPFASLLTRRGPSAVRLSSRLPQLYQTAETERRFTFQVSGRQALIRFHCPEGNETLECKMLAGDPHEEIHLLEATRSPRGDVIYKDDDGHAVLRVTATGGATLYDILHSQQGLETSNGFVAVQSGGQAVLPVTAIVPDDLSPPHVTKLEIAEKLRRASELMAVRHAFFISFLALDDEAMDQTILADTILMTVKAIDLVAADEIGSRVINERLRRVEFIPHKASRMTFEDGILTVFYKPEDGISGRPSSTAISRYLESVL